MPATLASVQSKIASTALAMPALVAYLGEQYRTVDYLNWSTEHAVALVNARLYEHVNGSPYQFASLEVDASNALWFPTRAFFMDTFAYVHLAAFTCAKYGMADISSVDLRELRRTCVDALAQERISIDRGTGPIKVKGGTTSEVMQAFRRDLAALAKQALTELVTRQAAA